jgi:hypothetical protein
MDESTFINIVSKNGYNFDTKYPYRFTSHKNLRIDMISMLDIPIDSSESELSLRVSE